MVSPSSLMVSPNGCFMIAAVIPHQIMAIPAGTSPIIVAADRANQNRKTIMMIDIDMTSRCTNLDGWIAISSAIEIVSAKSAALDEQVGRRLVRVADHPVAAAFFGLVQGLVDGVIKFKRRVAVVRKGSDAD